MTIALGFLSVIVFLLYVKLVNTIKTGLPNVVYADRNGVTDNPPINFIDTWTNKTINFKVGQEVVSIAGLPVHICIKYVSSISYQYKLLLDTMEYNPVDEVDKFNHYKSYIGVLDNLAEMIYQLCHPYVKNKNRLRNTLLKETYNNMTFIMDVCEQVTDYWKTVKKKALLLARGTTLQETVGEAQSWNSLKVDNDGKILMKPRYANFWNSRMRKTKEQKEQTNSIEKVN